MRWGKWRWDEMRRIETSQRDTTGLERDIGSPKWDKIWITYFKVDSSTKWSFWRHKERETQICKSETEISEMVPQKMWHMQSRLLKCCRLIISYCILVHDSYHGIPFDSSHVLKTMWTSRNSRGNKSTLFNNTSLQHSTSP